jgi:hypothetical protein
MTDIINVDLEKIIESSISELTKKLSSELNKKVREDVINNLMKTTTTKSIYGLDDIKDFGKFNSESPHIQCQKTMNYSHCFNHNSQYYYSGFKENEYPILHYSECNNGSGRNYYITNIIDGLLLNNDDILLLVLFSINRIKKTFVPSANFIKYLVQNNYIDVDWEKKIQSGFPSKLNNSLRRYFASVNDNKIKAFEFDKLLEKYKELEDNIYNIQENENKLQKKITKLEEENYIYCKKILLENNKQKETIIDLEDKNKNLEEEYNKLFTIFTETKEELYKTNKENNNLIEELNKLFTVFTESKDENNKTKEELNKTKEENIKLSDEWLILKDKTIAKFEEDNYKLRMEKDKLVKNNNELLKKIAELEKNK